MNNPHDLPSLLGTLLQTILPAAHKAEEFVGLEPRLNAALEQLGEKIHDLELQLELWFGFAAWLLTDPVHGVICFVEGNERSLVNFCASMCTRRLTAPPAWGDIVAAAQAAAHHLEEDRERDHDETAAHTDVALLAMQTTINVAFTVVFLITGYQQSRSLAELVTGWRHRLRPESLGEIGRAICAVNIPLTNAACSAGASSVTAAAAFGSSDYADRFVTTPANFGTGGDALHLLEAREHGDVGRDLAFISQMRKFVALLEQAAKQH